MKKFITVLLSFTLISALLCPANAINEDMMGPIQNYHAQVYHAVGVNEYGSNIYDVSEVITDLPVSIAQNSAGDINIVFNIDDYKVQVNGTVNGINMAENMLYYNAYTDSNEMTVLVMDYINTFSNGIIISQDYITNNPTSKDVLQVYLKVNNSNAREYYFLEIFDFQPNNWSTMNKRECIPEYWFAKEFLPTNTQFIEEDGPAMFATPHTKFIGIVDTYIMLRYTVRAALRLKTVADISDVPCGQTTEWTHTIMIESQSTSCTEAPELNSNTTSPLSIYNVTLTANVPKNCGLASTTIDGTVSGGLFGAISASLSVARGPLSVSFNLYKALTSIGSVDINDTYDTYDNSTSDMVKVIKVDFSKTSRQLSNIGDYLSVTSHVRDYGNATTSTETLSAKWTLTVNQDATSGTDVDKSNTTEYTVRVK